MIRRPPGSTRTATLLPDTALFRSVLYFAVGLSRLNAVDTATGKLLWEYDPKVGEVAGEKLRLGWGIRGIAYWNGKIYTRSAEHTSELQSLMRISYAVFCLKKKINDINEADYQQLMKT